MRISRTVRNQGAGFADQLSRTVAWELPGVWNGRLAARYSQRVTTGTLAIHYSEGGASPPGLSEPPDSRTVMTGEFSGLLSRLQYPRQPHIEAPPPANAGRHTQREGWHGFQLAGWRLSEYEDISASMGGAKPPGIPASVMRRYETLDWRWGSTPLGEFPGGFERLRLPDRIMDEPKADGPLVLAAPLAAYLLHRMARAGVSHPCIEPLRSAIAFDDEGFPPGPDGMLARRSTAQPWPHPAPAGLTFALPGAPARLPASFIAYSFLNLELDSAHFSWALPIFEARDGELRALAGLHVAAGSLDELLGAVIAGEGASGRRRARHGVASVCESPALILRPLSKMKGRRVAFKPAPAEPSADFVRRAAREFIADLL